LGTKFLLSITELEGLVLHGLKGLVLGILYMVAKLDRVNRLVVPELHGQLASLLKSNMFIMILPTL